MIRGKRNLQLKDHSFLFLFHFFFLEGLTAPHTQLSLLPACPEMPDMFFLVVFFPEWQVLLSKLIHSNGKDANQGSVQPHTGHPESRLKDSFRLCPALQQAKPGSGVGVAPTSEGIWQRAGVQIRQGGYSSGWY